MMTRIDDPKNHTPKVSSNDALENSPAGTPPNFSRCRPDSVILPPLRAKNEFTTLQDDSLDHPEKGFLIVPSSHIADNSSATSEIQKFEDPVVRLEKAASSPAKSPRQGRFTPLPQTDSENANLHEVEHKWGRPFKRSIRWIISGGIGVASLLVFALIMLPTINEPNAARPSLGQNGLVIDQAEKIGTIENLNEWLGRRSEAMQLFQTFATSSIADDLLPIIRDSVKIQELVRKDRLQHSIPRDWSPPQSSTWIAFEAGDQVCGVLEGTLPDFSNFRAYMVDSGNRLVLDWKATTGYSSASFDDLASGHGDPGEIRAFISPSGYYNDIFIETNFHSYQLVSPDKNQSIWCYTRRGGTAEYELEKLFYEGEIIKPEKLAYRVTVRLARGPEGTLPNQWVLEELLHHEWAGP